MARFATYYIRYNEELAPYDWEDRQEHLSALFSQDNSITFGEGVPSDEQKKNGFHYAKIFNHRVYHLKCNPRIIVMQFANSIDIPLESKFEQSVVKDEPSLFVIIDNRKDIRTVAIQNRRKAFSAPKRVAPIMEDLITRTLFNDHCYSAEILPEYYPADLFKAWQEQQKHAQSLRFSSSEEMTYDEIMQSVEKLKDKDFYDNSLMPSLLQLALEAKKAKYKHKFTVMPEDKKTALNVDKTTTFMKNLVTLARATKEPVELVTKEGAVFKCFVEPEDDSTDKIVHHNLDDSWLEMLFKGKKKDGSKAESEDMAKAEAAVVELLNSIKHMSEDIEKKEDAA